MKTSHLPLAVASAAWILTSGCSSTDGGTSGSQGGANGGGGTSTIGSTAIAGGTTATGGSMSSNTGGTSTGGLATGGVSNSTTGGSTANGGTPSNGGTKATGGAPSTVGGSGVSSGGAVTGGTASKGGSNSGGVSTGGLTSSGGANPTGGMTSSGGTTQAGGSSGAGGSSAATNAHMYTQGSDLYAACGEKVLLRGLNQMSIWTDATGSSYPAIASFGTNAIRIVYTVSGDATGLDSLLTKAEANKMIPMPEIHDATGKFDGVAAAVTWWTQASIVSVIKKHEKWTLLNIANEAGDNNVSDATFQSTYTSAITALRNAGITVPIVIDGSGWGQKVEQLLTVAPALLAADPQKNVIFSWHEYTGGAQENDRITKSLEKSKSLGIVLINGEFANGGAGTCATDIPYKFLIAEAQRIGTGWFAWSWDTSNSDCKSGGTSIFNMTTNLTAASGLAVGWAADVVRDDPNSIKNTSVRHCEWK